MIKRSNEICLLLTYPRSPSIWVQYGCETVQHKYHGQIYYNGLLLTPARTLVISRTRMPANGRIDVSGAVVASPRYRPLVLEPLTYLGWHNGLQIAWNALGAAMMTHLGVETCRGKCKNQ